MKTLEQTAQEYLLKTIVDKDVKSPAYNTMINFKAGASWREQQSAKLLAEKDAEIAELKKKTGFKTGFCVRECNNCGHNWSRED